MGRYPTAKTQRSANGRPSPARTPIDPGWVIIMSIIITNSEGRTMIVSIHLLRHLERIHDPGTHGDSAIAAVNA
jgi:hypothetical protein